VDASEMMFGDKLSSPDQVNEVNLQSDNPSAKDGSDELDGSSIEQILEDEDGNLYIED